MISRGCPGLPCAKDKETSMRIASGFIVLALALAAGQAGAASREPQTVQAIMDTVVDPSADSLWETAGTVETAKGGGAHRPHTARQWAQARGLALKLVAGAKLLQARRPVGGDGHWTLADASTPGIRTAAQIEADIARDPGRFYAAAARLQRTAQDAADALGRHDLDAFLDAGARIDAACEACHAAYWYPRNAPRPLPDPAAFARIASRP
jgi:cytochrome c556